MPATGRRYTLTLKQVPVSEPIFRPSTWVGAKASGFCPVLVDDMTQAQQADKLDHQPPSSHRMFVFLAGMEMQIHCCRPGKP
jgi:hypothetical protein